jgi:signal peptidase I
MQSPADTRLASVKMLVILVVLSALSVAFLHRYVFALYVIEGSSMAPTLNAGDKALVNMLVRRTGTFERKQIVLVEDGYAEYATKRIIGMPGEKLEIRDGHVFVDGRLLSEPYLARNTETVSRHSIFVLHENQYFVMGDNRSDSLDSRDYGPIKREAIIGSYSRAFWACR